MGVFKRGRRRGGRWLGRFADRLADMRLGAAEGVLGLVALVLVVWLLWPEDRSPQLDQRVVWEDSVQAAERRMAELDAERARKEADTASKMSSLADTVRDATPEEASAAPTYAERRRRIAMPSELADRLDSFGRRPGHDDLREAVKPAPARPTVTASEALAGLVMDDRATPTAVEAAGQPEIAGAADAPVSPSVRDKSVRDKIDEALRALRDTDDEAVDLAASPLSEDAASSAADRDHGAGPSLEVAALSSEALDYQPLAEVDLSDLDTLTPPDIGLSDDAQAAVAPTAPIVNLPPVHEQTEPFVVDGERESDVRARPRDDAPTWMRNAVAASVFDDRPMIAIVIDDLGLNRSNTALLNSLPAPLTLAFLPYAGRIDAQTRAAQEAGHELMLHLPMEPLGSQWPGPDALTTRIDQDEFVTRLQKNLDRFDDFVGINNHMGSRLTADRARMDVVMRELRKRDVLFLDSKTNPRSIAVDMAGENGVPNTSRDVFLDHVIDLGTIRRQLARAEQIARQTGSAVAIGHPHNATIEALRGWLPDLEARGFRLAPISAVVARRACSEGVLIASDTCGRYLQVRATPEPSIAVREGRL